MLNSLTALDALFQALSESSRRSILQRLSKGTATVSELARPLAMSLAAVVQHVQKLEACGLVTTTKHGRVRRCALNTQALQQAENWLSERRLQWESRLDRLGVPLDDAQSNPHT